MTAQVMTAQKILRRWRPARPAVPPLLWATTVAIVVAGLNVVFYVEIWSSVATIERGWLGLLGPLLLAGLQAMPVLWRWPPPPLAPLWGQMLWRVGMSAAVAGLCLGLLFGTATAGLLVAYIHGGGFAGNR